MKKFEKKVLNEKNIILEKIKTKSKNYEMDIDNLKEQIDEAEEKKKINLIRETNNIQKKNAAIKASLENEAVSENNQNKGTNA